MTEESSSRLFNAFSCVLVMLLFTFGHQLFRVDVKEARMRSFSALGRCCIPCSMDDTICDVCSFLGAMAKFKPRLRADLSVSLSVLSDKFMTHFSFRDAVSDTLVTGMILLGFLVCLVLLWSVSH